MRTYQFKQQASNPRLFQKQPKLEQEVINYFVGNAQLIDIIQVNTPNPILSLVNYSNNYFALAEALTKAQELTDQIIFQADFTNLLEAIISYTKYEQFNHPLITIKGKEVLTKLKTLRGNANWSILTFLDYFNELSKLFENFKNIASAWRFFQQDFEYNNWYTGILCALNTFLISFHRAPDSFKRSDLASVTQVYLNIEEASSYIQILQEDPKAKNTSYLKKPLQVFLQEETDKATIKALSTL